MAKREWCLPHTCIHWLENLQVHEHSSHLSPASVGHRVVPKKQLKLWKLIASVKSSARTNTQTAKQKVETAEG